MNEALSIVLLVPAILFLCVVAPIWLILHYGAKRRAQSALSSQERAELDRLTDYSEGLTERIDALESILDEQTPDWRNQNREDEP